MTRYVMLLNFTEKGLAAVKDSPSRAQAFRQAAESAGAKIESLYWTMGACDGLLVLSAPDEATAASLALRLAKSGHVTTTTLRAFDADEFTDIVGKIG